MNQNEALEYIADGHAVYGADTGKEVLLALGVPWQERYARPMHSDKPGTFKGLTLNPGNEGARMITALHLGDIACGHYGLQPASKFGRGSQGFSNASALREWLQVPFSRTVVI